MVSKDRLYQTFGELVYVLAMADGVIQKEEVNTLKQLLSSHPNGKDIQWSFDYETQQNSDIETLYKKVIAVFSDHGPDEEYDFMIQTLHKVAEASDGVDKSEEKVMTNFTRDLLQRFTKDIHNIKEKYQ